MKRLTPYMLLVPQLLVGSIFLTGIIIGITQSLGVIPVFGLYKPTLLYYREILQRPETLQGMLYSIKIAALSAFLSVLLGVFLCYLLISLKKDRGFMLHLSKVPILVPHVIVALMFIHLISQNGLLARICFQLGFIKEQAQFPLWVYDAGGKGVILAYLWKEVPFVIYFVIALMSSISTKLGEAARNLGATQLRAFCKVTLPLCFDSILSAFIILFTYALGAYELPLLMGATLPRALPIMTYLEFQKPDLRLRPYAMAYNGILILLSAAAAFLYFILLYKKAKEYRG